MAWEAEQPVGWPLVYLLERELALDTVEGVPVVVTYCSLCSTARVFDRRLGGEELDLRVSGLLRGVGSLLFDTRTESLFEQASGRGLVGAHSGQQLALLPSYVVSFASLLEAYPEARVLQAPSVAGAPNLALLSAENIADGQLPNWISSSCPDPLGFLLDFEGRAVLLHDPMTAPVHRTREGTLGAPVGSIAAFSPVLDGVVLVFKELQDKNTGSSWNPLGEAISGPLRGSRLRPLVQTPRLRFSQP